MRTHGQNLILGRPETGPAGKPETDDRVKLTRLGTSTWGLSVKRHTGRRERTPFSGTLREMVEVIGEPCNPSWRQKMRTRTFRVWH